MWFGRVRAPPMIPKRSSKVVGEKNRLGSQIGTLAQLVHDPSNGQR